MTRRLIAKRKPIDNSQKLESFFLIFNLRLISVDWVFWYTPVLLSFVFRMKTLCVLENVFREWFFLHLTRKDTNLLYSESSLLQRTIGHSSSHLTTTEKLTWPLSLELLKCFPCLSSRRTGTGGFPLSKMQATMTSWSFCIR